MRYLLGFRIPVEDAEEILQEVFLALFQHLRRGKSRLNLRSWVFRVAHNLALKRKEAHAKVQSVASLEVNMDQVFVDAGPNPEDQLVSSQNHRSLQMALHALPEQDQRCLALRAEGLRYREIAEILNISLGGVSLCLARSLGRLARVADL